MVFCAMLHSLNKVEKEEEEEEPNYIKWDSVEAQNSTSISFYFGNQSFIIPPNGEAGAIKAKNWTAIWGNTDKDSVFSLLNSNGQETEATLEFDVLNDMEIHFLAEPEYRANGGIWNNINQNSDWDHALMTLAVNFTSYYMGSINSEPPSQKKGIYIKNIPYSNYELRLYFSNSANNYINPISIVEYDNNNDNDIDNGIIHNKFCAQGPGNWQGTPGAWPINSSDPLGGAPGYRANHINNLSDITSNTTQRTPTLKNGESYIHPNYILIENLTKSNIFITTPNYTDFSNILTQGLSDYFRLSAVQITTYSN